MVEESSNSADPGKTSNFDRYVHATKMQPQSSGSLRSNAGVEKGKEIAAKLNIHRVHGQLRGLDTTGGCLQYIFSLTYINVGGFHNRKHNIFPLNIASILVFHKKKVFLDEHRMFNYCKR